jgi:hypothetical protein
MTLIGANRTAIAVAALALLPFTMDAAPEPTQPVTVLGCIVTPDLNGRLANGTRIVFVNTGSTVLHSITFDIDYHTLDNEAYRTITDAGTFAPGVRIDHHYDAFIGTSYNGNQTKSCVVTDAR